MKKKFSLIFYIVFFLAVLLIEEYCLLEYRKDYITVIGITCALLIAAYLLLDSIKHEIIEKYEMIHGKIENEYKQINKKIDTKYEAILNLEKAIYVATKKKSSNLEYNKNKLSNLDDKK